MLHRRETCGTAHRYRVLSRIYRLGEKSRKAEGHELPRGIRGQYLDCFETEYIWSREASEAINTGNWRRMWCQLLSLSCPNAGSDFRFFFLCDTRTIIPISSNKSGPSLITISDEIFIVLLDDVLFVIAWRKIKYQGHPTWIFGKYLLGKRLEI